MKIIRVTQRIAEFGYYNAHYVEIETASGVIGQSEVGMRRRTRAVSALIDELGEYLIGKDARAIEKHFETMYRDSFLGGTLLTIAISALDVALWDLNARDLGVPVHRLLGGAFRSQVPVYTHARATESPQAFAREVADRVAQGFTAVKTTLPGFYSEVSSVHHVSPARIPPRQTETELLPNGIWDVVAEYFAAARDEVGPSIALMLDCHGRLNVPNALRLIKALEPYDLTFIEEPVPYERVDWMSEVARRSTIPVAAGERWANHYAAAPFLEAHAVGVAQPDVAWCGGITAAKKIATIAETHGISIAFHNPFGALASAAAWQLGSTLPNFMISESMITPDQQTYWDRYVNDAPIVNNGAWTVTNAPGLGPILNVGQIEEHPFDLAYDVGGTR